MRIELFNLMMSRRNMMKGTAATAVAAATGGLAALPQAAKADDLRAAILAVPGVGKGQPTDADWQKVGEMCLGATKAGVKEGEFKGIELSFMGLNNQNVHNVLFRGL
jgi:multiple sugar transport system substrate-binding protein